MDQAAIWHGGFLRPIRVSYTVLFKLSISRKKGTRSSVTLSQALGFKGRKTRCDKLATVFGRTKCTVVVTVDIGQCITLSVHICVQHDVREAASRAGPSATADTCCIRRSAASSHEKKKQHTERATRNHVPPAGQ